jgi:hypothetical protein
MPRPPQAEIRLAQHHIFNRLCIIYLRGKDRGYIRAADLQKQLAIPESAFAEALLRFQRGDKLIVEVIESDQEVYLRLGESSRYNCD